jgi:hypothetical protein
MADPIRHRRNDGPATFCIQVQVSADTLTGIQQLQDIYGSSRSAAAHHLMRQGLNLPALPPFDTESPNG